MSTLDRQVLESQFGSTKIIQEFVTRDRVHPRCEWLRSIVRLPMGMNGDERLLQEVLRLGGPMTDSCKVVSVVRAQVGGETLQKLVICSCVAFEAGCHESPKLVLMSEFVHLSPAG